MCFVQLEMIGRLASFVKQHVKIHIKHPLLWLETKGRRAHVQPCELLVWRRDCS
jgi:hypothetical protein